MLQASQRIIIAGEQWTVAYVNFSRAHCMQQCRELVEIRKWGRTVRTFWRPGGARPTSAQTA